MFTLAALALTFKATGADMPMENGRFVGKVSVVRLSKPQIALIENRDILRLTPAQRGTLASEAGLAPTEFFVCDTRLLASECACAEWNRALRFSDREVEIPHEYLVPDREAVRRKRELETASDTASADRSARLD